MTALAWWAWVPLAGGGVVLFAALAMFLIACIGISELQAGERL